MNFQVDTADTLKIADSELADLLSVVYVEGGFTEVETAHSIFEPTVVRQRGTLLGAREIENSVLAGMVIIVPPDSPACRLAHANETEMHLLGVKPDYRRHGLGRILVNAAIHNAKRDGYSKMILWTQPTMQAAHLLYESCGFERRQERDFSKNGRDFRIYEQNFVND